MIQNKKETILTYVYIYYSISYYNSTLELFRIQKILTVYDSAKYSFRSTNQPRISSSTTMPHTIHTLQQPPTNATKTRIHTHIITQKKKRKYTQYNEHTTAI